MFIYDASNAQKIQLRDGHIFSVLSNSEISYNNISEFLYSLLKSEH